MVMLKISFEEVEGHRFAHIWSDDGVLGHAAEIHARIPKDTWLSIPDHLERLEPWLIAKCGFKYMFSYKLEDGGFLDLLRKE